MHWRLRLDFYNDYDDNYHCKYYDGHDVDDYRCNYYDRHDYDYDSNTTTNAESDWSLEFYSYIGYYRCKYSDKHGQDYDNDYNGYCYYYDHCYKVDELQANELQWSMDVLWQ